jgi:hypothetical protein
VTPLRSQGHQDVPLARSDSRCQHAAMVHLSVEAMADGNGLAKPSDQAWELNVVAPLAGLRQLQGIEDTDWAQRRTLQVGNCLDTPVWWSEADGRVYVLVGEDGEVRRRGRHNPALYRPGDPRTRREGTPAVTPPGTTATATSPQDKRLTRSCPARAASCSGQLLLRQDSRRPGRITAPARPLSRDNVLS